MKTIIAGSRSITRYAQVVWAIERSGFKITEVVSGRARGVDLLGERWAEERGIPVKWFEVTDVDWEVTGKKAGHMRNREMAAYGDAAIILWDGASSGSLGMYQEAKLVGLKIYAPCMACSGQWGVDCQDCGGKGDACAHLLEKERRAFEEL